MFRFIGQRMAQSAMVVVAMSIIVFFGLNVVGNPVDLLLPAEATQEDIDIAIHNFGLDKPVFEQYLTFVSNAFHGELGNSFVAGRSALVMIIERFPATFELALLALVIAIVAGFPLGMVAGYASGRPVARGIMFGSIFGFSLPTFWVGLMFIMIFAVQLGWLPANGRGETVDIFGIRTSLFTVDGLQHLLLPALNLALFKVSLVIRLVGAGAREVLQQDYIKFARAKGLSQSRITAVHVLKNILIPVVTVLGMEFGQLLAFSVVTESVFAWPGMGSLLIQSIQTLDRPVVVAYLILIVLVFLTINLIVDVLYLVLDPRVRYRGAAR